MSGEFKYLTQAQKAAVRSVVDSSRRDFRTFKEPAADGTCAYAYRNCREQTFWGVIDTDGDHIARGELEADRKQIAKK